MSRNHALIQLIGWLLFLACAILFLVSGIRAGDLLLVAGSVVFLVACVVFVIPIMPLVRAHGTEADSTRQR